LYDKKEMEGAIKNYLLAIKLDPNYAKAHFNLGRALRDKKDADAAVKHHRLAIKIDPEFAEAHCGLGLSLRDLGLLIDSLASLRRGHELGSGRADWHHPSQQWIHEAERLVQLQDHLPHILTGKEKPASAAERVEYFRVARLTQQYRALVKLLEDAFIADPKLEKPNRLNAARAAALAGCGKGKDNPPVAPKEQPALRQKALQWLQAELSDWEKLAKNSPKSRPNLLAILQRWQQDPDLAGVRREALMQLPEDERAAWQKLWRAVAALQQQLEK
jgi:TPR repeat